MRIRSMLTEVLLEVTDQEIDAVASEAFEEARSESLCHSLGAWSRVVSVLFSLFVRNV